MISHESSAPEEDERLLRHRDLSINLDRIRVTYRNRIVDVSPAQFRLLCYVIKRPGSLVTVAELEAELWSTNETRSNSAAALMYRLRQALMKAGARNVLRTVHRKGYVLD